MATRDFLTPENLQIMLDETYGNQQTQDFIRPNPLQFQYPYIPGGIMNTGSVMYDEFPPGFNFTPQGPSQKFEFLPEAYNQSEDVEQVEYLPGQEPSGIEKLFNKVQSIPGAVKSGLLSLIGKVNPALSFIGGGLSSIVNLPKFFQERRDARARAEAAERGAAKQQEMARQTAFQAMRGNDAYGGGGGRPGGFGQGAGDFSASDPTATEGSF